MANRNFPARNLYNSHVMPCLVDMQIAIGATGAPTLSSAPFVKSVTRLAAGTYQIQLQDNYAALLGMDANAISPVSGAATDPHSVSLNTLVQITTVGNTNWASAGLSSSITPAVGVTFFLTADPGAGTTGRVKTIGSSGVSSIELCGAMMNSNAPSQGAGNNGAFIVIQCQQAQIGAATTQGSALQYAAADPANGSTLQIALYLNNSSVQ